MPSILEKITHKVLDTLKQLVNSVLLWSDLIISLAWSVTSANVLKTFESNTVSEIQQLSKDFRWLHIPSECNPADMVSLGLDLI